MSFLIKNIIFAGERGHFQQPNWSILVKNGHFGLDFNLVMDFNVIISTIAAQNRDFSWTEFRKVLPWMEVSNPKRILWGKKWTKIEVWPKRRKFQKNPSVIPLVISNLKCVQIGFYFPKFLKFPKIYFYFCVIIIFGDPFDATPIVQGPMGQFILLWPLFWVARHH